MALQKNQSIFRISIGVKKGFDKLKDNLSDTFRIIILYQYLQLLHLLAPSLEQLFLGEMLELQAGSLVTAVGIPVERIYRV